MYRFLAAVTSLALIVAAAPVVAADCTGHPAALGTSRVLTVDPMQFHRVGTMQYPETLPLRDHEVVLTFDDGPLSPYTERVLDALQAECVRATFFVVGRMAKAYPSLVRRASSDGHTIASHSQDHRIIGRRLAAAGAKQDYETGVATVATVLGSRNAVAPFIDFRDWVAQRRSSNISQRAASWCGVPIFRPTIGSISRRIKLRRAHWRGSNARAEVFCYCTIYSRRLRKRCQACCANCRRDISISCMWCQAATMRRSGH